MGPSWLLPKKKSDRGGSVSYEGFDVVDFPKGGAESIRQNLHDLRDAIDRDNAIAKPAGAGVAGAGTVSQSGISKAFDNERLNNKLSGIADVMQAAERALADLALVVLGDGKPPADAVTVEYSKQFDLTDVEDMGAFCGALLKILGDPAAPGVPTISGEFLKAMVRQALPGREDATYDAWDAELDAALAKAKADAEAAKAAELAAMAQPPTPPAIGGGA